MNKIGIDLGKRKSDICIMDSAQEVSAREKVATTREALGRALAKWPGAEVAIEAGRDAGWVHAELTRLGHEVVMVDTTRVRALGVGQGRRKTDRRDAEALARALWTGAVPRAHVLSERATYLRDVLHARGQLVAQRTSLVTQLRGQWQARGRPAPRCGAVDFARRLRAAGDEAVRAVHVQALLAVVDAVSEQITVLDAQLEALSEREESYERLSSIAGVKRIVGLTFIAALDEPNRFRNAHEVQAYLGLVPSEASTGGKRRLGGITKTGNSMARWALVQAAHTLRRARKHADDPLVLWSRQVEARRGKRKAVVALARRLAGVLWAMWTDGTFYDAQALGRASADGLTRRARRAAHEARAMRAAAQVM